MRRLSFPLLLAAGLLSLAFGPSSPGSSELVPSHRVQASGDTEPLQDYAGNETCVACHDDLENSL